MIEKVGMFLLFGIILGVGMFGGYVVIVVVFFGIVGLILKWVDVDVVVFDLDYSVVFVEYGGE